MCVRVCGGMRPQSQEIPQFIINRYILALCAGEGHCSHRKITPQWVFDVLSCFVFLNFNEGLSRQRGGKHSALVAVAKEQGLGE